MEFTYETFKQHGLWHVVVPHALGSVHIRPRYPDEPLTSASRLAYDVLCAEKQLVDESALSEDMRRKQEKWDDWDPSDQTLHFFATLNGEVIGRMRIIMDGPLGLPIERNGFAVDRHTRARRAPLCEVSKLMLDRRFRASGLLAPFYWFVYESCAVARKLPTAILSCEPFLRTLYYRIGATDLGTFFNTEFQQSYSAMQIDFADTFAWHLADKKLVMSAGCDDEPPPRAPIAAALKTLFATRHPGFDVRHWQATTLKGGGGATTDGLWRILVDAASHNQITSDWTCVVKAIVAPADTAAAPDNPIPWDHEASFYRGTSHALPRGLRAPRLLGTDAIDDKIHLFLEDVRSPGTSRLSPAHLPQLARLLGGWHGATSTDTPPLAGWLDWYVEAGATMVGRIPELAATIAALAPLDDVVANATVHSFWAQRREALQILRRLPHVRSHQDLVARNVIARQSDDADEHVLFDWALYGSAPLGAELAPLLFGSALLFEWTVEEALAALPPVVDAYLLGLQEAGWPQSREAVTLGLSLSAALRYVAWGGHRIEAALDPARHRWAEQTVGRPLPDIVARYAEVRRAVVALGLQSLEGAGATERSTPCI